MKTRTFPSFPYSAREQVCRSWEGAQPGRSPSCPVEILHTMDIMFSLGMGVGWGARILPYHFLEFKSSLGQEREHFWKFSFFWNVTKSTISGICNHCLGTGCNSVIRQGASCIVYSSFCKCIIIISSSSIGISFVVSPNCLCLNPRVSPFVHFPSQSRWRCWEGVSEWLLGPSCWLMG